MTQFSLCPSKLDGCKCAGAIDAQTGEYVIFAHRDAYLYTPKEGVYDEQIRYLAENVVAKVDRAAFLQRLELRAVLEHLHIGGAPYAVAYRLVTEEGEILCQKMEFSYFGSHKATVLVSVYDETPHVLGQPGRDLRNRLKEERFHFLIRNMCVNFMEVNVQTGQSILTTSEDNVSTRGFWKEQIQWFADNMVVPEERERYLDDFALENLVSRIENNHGLDVTPCTVRHKGGLRNLLITSTLIRDAYARQHIFAYAQDITKVKQEEAKNREVVLNALQKAEQAGRAKDEFLSRMSHEIRTPLNAITGITELARRACGDPDKVLLYLNKIGTSSDHLLSIINDILDKAKIESGKLAICNEPFSLRQMFEKLQVLFQAKAEEKNIDFQCNMHTSRDRVDGDFLRVSQVLVNLLSNAFKFTPCNGTVLVSVYEAPAAERTDHLRFAVTDTGIGICPEHLDKIFDAFVQAESSTLARFGGTGLGLSISRSLVRLMGGELRVRSRAGKGSEFFFTIPLPETADARESVAEEGKLPAEDFAGRRLLVVEDNELNVEVLVTLLEYAGILSDVAKNGREAVEKFRNAAPGYYDALLMDVLMPVMDGLEATLEIRATLRPDARSVPIIGMSANAFDEDKKKALDVGMNAYTTKPLDIPKIYALLRDLLPVPKAEKPRSR